jgi:hypothetical protein
VKLGNFLKPLEASSPPYPTKIRENPVVDLAGDSLKKEEPVAKAPGANWVANLSFHGLIPTIPTMSLTLKRPIPLRRLTERNPW